MTARPPAPHLPATPLAAWALWGRRALWTLGGLALTFMTAWAGAYFWLGSTPGRAQLLALVPLPAGVAVGAVRWGPAFDEVALGDVRVNAGGREVAHVRSAALDVGLGAFIGGDVVVDVAEIELSHVEVTTGADGKVDIIAALTPPPRPPTVGTVAGPQRKSPEVKKMTLVIDETWVDVAGLQAHVRDLRIEGTLPAAEAADPAPRFEVRTGACHAAWNKGRRSIGFDECLVAASVQDKRLEVRALRLSQREEVLAMEGMVDLSGARPVSRWSGHGHLGRLEALAIAGASLPSGFDFDGLELATDGGNVTGTLGQVIAERWVSGPFSADHLAFSIDRFTAAPGLLVPELEITVRGLAAARLEGLGWCFEGLWVPRADGDLEKKLVAAAGGAASAWTLPSGSIGEVVLRVATQLKLTGGVIEVDAESAHGTVEARGTLKSSPLTKKTDFIAEVFFAGATGPLSAALMHDFDDEQRVAFGEPVGGMAEFEVEVDREDRFAPWVTTLEWALGRLDGPKTSLEWDGYGWGPPAPPPPPEVPP